MKYIVSPIKINTVYSEATTFIEQHFALVGEACPSVEH